MNDVGIGIFEQRVGLASCVHIISAGPDNFALAKVETIQPAGNLCDSRVCIAIFIHEPAIFYFKANMKQSVHNTIGKVQPIILNNAAIALDQVIASFDTIFVIAMRSGEVGQPR